MSFRIPQQCADDWGKEPLHFIAVNDDGTLTLEDHDTDLELSLIELGAPEPRCIRGLKNYLKEPLGLILEIDGVLRHYGVGNSPHGFQNEIGPRLAVDFAQHAFDSYLVGAVEYRERANAVLNIARELFTVRIDLFMFERLPVGVTNFVDFSRDCRDAFVAAMAASDKVRASMAGHYMSHNFPLLLQNLGPMVMTTITPHQTYERVKQVAHVARVAARVACEQSGRLPSDCANQVAAELDWQKRHAVAAITSLVEGKSWPSA